jgi:hypothetical protein
MGLVGMLVLGCQKKQEKKAGPVSEGKPVAQQSLPMTAALPETQPSPIVDPEADRILKEMSDYLRSQNQFSVHAEISQDDILPTGQKIQLMAVNDVLVQRPNRVFSDYRGDAAHKRFWYEGNTITLLDTDANIYATAVLPGTINSTLDALMKNYGFSPPLSDLLYDDPYAVMRANVWFGLYLGKSEIEDAPVHHLAFVQKYIDWQIWVEDGKTWVPRKIVITYKTLPGAPQFSAVLSDWDFTTPLASAAFLPVIPPQSIQAEFLPMVMKK